MNELLILTPILFLSATTLWMWRERRAMAATHQASQLALREARREIEALKQFLEGISLTAPVGLFLIDDRAQVVWFSHEARSWLMRGDASLPVSVHELIVITPLLSLINRALQEEREEVREFQVEDRWYWAHMIPLPLPSHLWGLTVKDVTELQRLGRARRDFVANISHDLRTPITTIQLLVEMLQMDAVKDPQERQQLLESIADQTLTLQQMAQELMDLSMIESGRMPLRLRPTPLHAIIEPVLTRLDMQLRHKNLTLLRHYEPDLAILADEEHMQRVIQNLLHNAIKFTPVGGRITIGARIMGEDVDVWIQDTGPGIPSEHLNRIFERFYKTDPARGGTGSGLGLSIARHIVEGHGGQIWAENGIERGAIFHFTLPRA